MCMSPMTIKSYSFLYFFFFQAEDGIRDRLVTGVQTCALPILHINSIVLMVSMEAPPEKRPLMKVSARFFGALERKGVDTRSSVRAVYQYRDRKSVV